MPSCRSGVTGGSSLAKATTCQNTLRSRTLTGLLAQVMGRIGRASRLALWYV